MTYIALFIVFFIAEIIYFKIAHKYNIMDVPSDRGSSKSITLRGGGIIFYIGALFASLYSGAQYPLFLIGITLVAIISFWDDVKSLAPKIRLSIQILAMLLMFYDIGLYSKTFWWAGIIAIIIYTGAMNIYNFMDGINGITGGYSLIVLLSFLYINSQQVEFINNSFIIIVILAVIVFCYFNFRKKAKCFAGDVGSVSIAFIILFLLGKLVFITKDFSCLCLLMIYGVDGCLTIIHRLMLSENISQPHRKHMYQIMANELKIRHTSVSVLYMSAQFLCSLSYILYPGFLTLTLQILILSMIYIIFMKKYFHLHQP